MDIIWDIKILVLSSLQSMEKKIENSTVQSHYCGKQWKEEINQWKFNPFTPSSPLYIEFQSVTCI